LVFGLPPAFRLISLAPRAGRARTIFLGVQVAVSSLLLVVSGLLLGGLKQLGHAEPGFDYRHLLWVSPGLKAHGYGGAAAKTYLDELGDRAGAWPDVQAVSQVFLGPWGNVHMGAAWMGRQFAGNRVDSQFLATMRMHLVRGRNLLSGEEGVVMITEAAARVLWPNEDALGKSLPWDGQGGAHGPTVVGVIANASTTVPGNSEPLEFYLPQSRSDAPVSALLVRVSGHPHDFVRRLQDAARSLDGRLQPTAPVVSDAYDDEMKSTSRALAAIAILGSVAILLSAIGLAGLAAYTVAQRTREIGLRIALGARAAQVVRAILEPMSYAILIGFLCGALGGAAVAKVLRSGIPGMAGTNVFDPLAYLAAMAFFAAVVALSILAPGRRAIRIDPSRALQHE
jgi:hypothetical protein